MPTGRGDRQGSEESEVGEVHVREYMDYVTFCPGRVPPLLPPAARERSCPPTNTLRTYVAVHVQYILMQREGHA